MSQPAPGSVLGEQAFDDLAAVRAAAALAGEWRSRAADLEARGVGRAQVAEAAAAGLYAVCGPARLGGVPAPAQRLITELLAGSSPDAWFVWSQHGPLVALLAAVADDAPGAGGRDRWLAPLCAGTATGGLAFSHLRASSPAVTARRVDGGWLLSGSSPWCTGWGLVDVVLAGAQSDDGQVLLGLVPARPGAGLTARPLGLSVMGGSSTVALVFDDVLLPDGDLVVQRSHADWRAEDARATANTRPATFGVARAALDGLVALAPAVEAALRERVDALRGRAYALLDAVPADQGLGERVEVRAQSMQAMLDAASALLVATGGSGLLVSAVAQRVLRAAAFQLVQAQTRPVREASLAVLAAGRDVAPG